MFELKETIEVHGDVEYHYLRRYWGKIPVSGKFISHTFDNQPNGLVKYRLYEDGADLVSEGCYQRNGRRLSKIGIWSYYRDGELRIQEVFSDKGIKTRRKEYLNDVCVVEEQWEKDKYVRTSYNEKGKKTACHEENTKEGYTLNELFSVRTGVCTLRSVNRGGNVKREHFCAHGHLTYTENLPAKRIIQKGFEKVHE